MAILGLFIQSENGIPVYKEAWSPKIQSLNEGDELLISGFMSAISQFAKSFNQEISYIRFQPIQFQDQMGVDSILIDIGKYLAITFVDPYQFHELVKLKLKWIYDRVLKNYEEQINYGRTIKLTNEEMTFCYEVINDGPIKNIVDKNRNKLIQAIDNLMNYNPDIRGVSINSFDNSILFNYGIERLRLENLLHYMGRGVSKVSEYEILHKPIIEENGESSLICLTNPAIPIKISDIIGDLAEGTVPLYYYVITDANCSIGPIVDSLIDILNPLIE